MTEFLDSPFGWPLVVIAGLSISIFILYRVVKLASYGRKQWVEAQKQTRILSAMAKATGVQEDAIADILNEDQYAESDDI
jgi:hypothetical protein